MYPPYIPFVFLCNFTCYFCRCELIFFILHSCLFVIIVFYTWSITMFTLQSLMTIVDNLFHTHLDTHFTCGDLLLLNHMNRILTLFFRFNILVMPDIQLLYLTLVLYLRRFLYTGRYFYISNCETQFWFFNFSFDSYS